MALKRATEEGGDATIDIKKEIRRAVDTGRVTYGLRQVLRVVTTRNAKAVIVSKNAPQRDKVVSKLHDAAIQVLNAPITSLELGSTCGKPFPVSYLVIEDYGDSQIEKLLKA